MQLFNSYIARASNRNNLATNKDREIFTFKQSGLVLYCWWRSSILNIFNPRTPKLGVWLATIQRLTIPMLRNLAVKWKKHRTHSTPHQMTGVLNHAFSHSTKTKQIKTKQTPKVKLLLSLILYTDARSFFPNRPLFSELSSKSSWLIISYDTRTRPNTWIIVEQSESSPITLMMPFSWAYSSWQNHQHNTVIIFSASSNVLVLFLVFLMGMILSPSYSVLNYVRSTELRIFRSEFEIPRKRQFKEKLSCTVSEWFT